MNQQTKIGIIVVFVILFLVCVKVIVTELPKEIGEREIIQYKADSIKTHLYIEDMQKTKVDVIANIQQLYNYNNVFDAQNLNMKLEQYTKDFFNNNNLIIVTIQDGSGSISNSVGDVIRKDKSTIDIIVNKKVPEVATADMAMSHLIIEINKSYLKNITNILVNGK